MKKNILSIILTFCCMSFIFSSKVFASLEIVTATPELADIAKFIGGDKVSVYSIAKPNQDYHLIEPRPSDVTKIARADLVIRIGMDIDSWLDALMNAAGNSKVNRGGQGYVDASAGIHKLEVPTGQITGASGDIHVHGNPHYYYDPEESKTIARNILEALERISPDNKNIFQNNYQNFVKEIDTRMTIWKKELEPYKGKEVVTYHKSSIYFLERFGLKEFGNLEPKPGIPPSASHIQDLIQRMKDKKITAIVIESIYPTKFADLVAREIGTKYQVIPASVGSLGTKNYFEYIDLMVKKHLEALQNK